MKKWKMVLASVLAALVLVLVPLSAMAQTATPSTVPAVKIKPDLVIVAPRAVLAGKEMQLTVFQRDNQKPVGEVAVWAIGKDKFDAAKQAIQNLIKNNAAGAVEPDYSAAVAPFGKRLGATDVNGVLTTAFTQDGNYLLVAFKAGFRPGFSGLVVRGLPKGLAITNPKMVKPGVDITITVHQKGSAEPVAGAGVWAVAADKAADVKGLLSDALSAAKNSPQATDYAALLNGKAISLGQTDKNGQTAPYAFANAGRYILVTFKAGYGPGFGTIAVVAPKPTPTPSATPNAKTSPPTIPSPTASK
jgi:hypothetical protein